MRIRHPRFDIPIESPSTTNEMRKHLLNSSQGSSFNKMSDAQQCKSRQSSPHLSSTDGHVSSISGLSESCEDSSNAYLNPDFTDSQLMTKCNSVGPSPLALLARTCQNIGNIMDCSISSNNRFISPTYNSTRKQSTVCSMPITNSNRIINNNNNNTLKLTKSKGVNSNDIISPSSNKRNITTKYLCTNDTIKMNLPTTAITGGESINQVNSVINSTTKINRNNNNNNNSNDSIVNSSLTLHHNTTRQSSPISISSTLFSQVNSIKSSDTSFIFNNNFIKSNDTQQTSNSLEQLARLSSSFSLPETSKLNYTNLKNSNDLIDNRTVWNDIKNTANNITTTTTTTNTTNNIQYDSNSLKRIKRRTNSNIKSSLTLLDECNSSTSVKRCLKDKNYSFIMNSMNNSINNHEYNHIQYESNTSSNITSNSINNYSQTENWINPITLNKQLTGYKETSNIMHNKDTQEKFSYQLARSFLDYFYGKLTNSINSESNNYPSTLCHPHTVTTNNTINTNINNNNNNNTVYKEDHNESINPLYMNNDRRTLEWLTNINLINQQQINEQSNLINHHQPTLTSSNTFPCLLCGQIFNGHTELCMHVYTHLLAFSIQETKKSNHMEEALRYLHSDTSQIRNNRPNSLLNENKNDSSFTPFVLPPPLPPSIMTTNIPTVTTASSVNYNPLQSFSIAESNHSFNSSDSIYLFQSYLSQWLRNFSSPNSNHQLQHEMINPSSLPNSSWISSDASTINKSMDYKTWQNILTTAYLYSMKESTSIASSGTIPSSTINSNSIPLQNSLQRNENSNYYDIFFGSKPFITPFPQS